MDKDKSYNLDKGWGEVDFNKRFNKTKAISFNKGWGLILNSDKGDGLIVNGDREGL